ncbi:MAG: hypothetical protein JNM86_04365 [Phycisphaerae bacterium]|nr:hypothetical protein [Phycisphaerae bacterium]
MKLVFQVILAAFLMSALTPAIASTRPKLILLGKTAEESPPYALIDSLHSVALAKGDGSRVAFGSYQAENAWRTYVWNRSTGCIVSVPAIQAGEDVCSPDGRPEKIYFCGISSTGEYVVGYSVGEYGKGAFRWQWGATYADDLLQIDFVSAARASGVSTNGQYVAISGDLGLVCEPGFALAGRLNYLTPAYSIMDTTAWECNDVPPPGVLANAITAGGETLVGEVAIYTRCGDGEGPEGYAWRWNVGSSPSLILLDSQPVTGAAFGVSNDASTVVGFIYNFGYLAFRAVGGSTNAELLADLPGSVLSSVAIDASPNWIVGTTSIDGYPRATAWLGEDADPVDLNARYACLKPENLRLTAATSVSDDGRYVAGRASYAAESTVWAWVVDHGSCPADFNEDGFVDDVDFVNYFTPAYTALVCSPCDATCETNCARPSVFDCTDFSDSPYNACVGDLNWDGVVDDADFAIFVVSYNLLECPPD